MSIVKVEMFACKCNICGKQWIDENTGFNVFTDEKYIQIAISEGLVSKEDIWYTDHATHGETKHYCPDCFEYDSEGEIHICRVEETEVIK